MSTRREFLKQGVVSGAGFMLAGGCHTGGSTGPFHDAAIKNLRDSLKGQIILPGDDSYDAARRVNFWNPTTERRPGAIARCETQDDIVRCVEFARQHDLVLAVRSGAHSFLGWGTCDHGLVIDVSPMKAIAVDPSNRTARVSAGVVAQELVNESSRHELVPVVGECPTVGVSGLTLGGGLGWLSGIYGAACDNLLSAELITGDGQSIVASPNSNTDLFWAIRGGGGNFGVVTSFEHRLHPVNVVFAGVLTYSHRDSRAMLGFYREFMAEATDELQAIAILAGTVEPALSLVVCFSGNPDDGAKIIHPLRTRLKPARDTMRRRAYSETYSATLLDEAAEAAADPEAFSHIKGCYLENLSDEVIDIAFGRFAHAPDSGVVVGFDHYMHGAVCRVPPNSTAFELRQPHALHVWISSAWSDPAATDEVVAWCEATWGDLQAYSGGRIYANYPNSEGEGAARSAYGGNYSRLVEIKQKYDPSNVFRRNQNLRPTTA